MKKIYKINLKKPTKDNLENTMMWEEQGIYIGQGDWNSNMGRDLLTEVINNIFDKNHFINNVNTLHRLPNLTLSRDKLSNFKEECNFKIIRDKNKADICVIGEKTVSKIFETTWSDINPLKEVKNYINTLQKNYTLNSKDLDFIKNKFDEISKDSNLSDENIMINFSNNYYYYDNEENTNYQKEIHKFYNDLDNYCFNNNNRGYEFYIKKEFYSIYDWIKNNKDSLIMDTELNKLCVQDSIALTKEEFERLSELVKSNDEDNVNIGLTLMANCNVEESKTELSLLFAFNSDSMKGRKVWTHVNFKYLKEIFGKYINMSMGNWGTSYDHLIKYMVEDKCLTLWSSRYIANAMFNNVLKNSFQCGKDDSVFTLTVDDLKLKSKYKDQLIDENDKKLSELILQNNHNTGLPF
jgi:hypothetical protein